MTQEGILRGIQVQGTPVRVPRRLHVETSASARPGEELAASYEDARRRGHREGLLRGHEEGRRDGHAEGLRVGREEAAIEARAAIGSAVREATAALDADAARLRQFLQEWQRFASELPSHAEDEMLAICFETICRIVGEAAVRPEAVSAMLRHVLASAREHPRVVLHVHPEDAALLDTCGLAAAPGQSVAWQADVSVATGGCVLRTPGGGLDCRLETLLLQCKSALLRARGQRHAGQPGEAGRLP